MSDEDLKQKLEKLQEQGVLTDAELAQLKRALPESTPTPAQAADMGSKKTFWLRVGLGILLLTGAAKSCQIIMQNAQINALRQQQEGQQEQLRGVQWGAKGMSSQVEQRQGQRDPDRETEFSRIKMGMTLAEV